MFIPGDSKMVWCQICFSIGTKLVVVTDGDLTSGKSGNWTKVIKVGRKMFCKNVYDGVTYTSQLISMVWNQEIDPCP